MVVHPTILTYPWLRSQIWHATLKYILNIHKHGCLWNAQTSYIAQSLLLKQHGYKINTSEFFWIRYPNILSTISRNWFLKFRTCFLYKNSTPVWAFLKKHVHLRVRSRRIQYHRICHMMSHVKSICNPSYSVDSPLFCGTPSRHRAQRITPPQHQEIHAKTGKQI